jgi:hypothetical protein
MIKKACLAATLVAAALLVPVSAASAAGPPDPIGFLEAARADPIGLVTWKLDLPIPSAYKPIAKPLVK